VLISKPVVPLSDMQPYGLMLMLYSILGYIFLVSKGADISQFNLLYVTKGCGHNWLMLVFIYAIIAPNKIDSSGIEN
jgi:hypothetical protein